MAWFFVSASVSVAVLLGTSLLLTGESMTWPTLAKCVGVGVVVAGAVVSPVVGALAVLLAACLLVFQKSLAEAIVISLVCGFILMGAISAMSLPFWTRNL